MKLSIFVLHALGDMLRARKTSVDHALFLKRYAPHHDYYYHDVNDPIPEGLSDARFHIVIFDTTALCIRYYRPKELFLREKQRLSFIANWDSVKIAFPQDDYDHSSVLDQWLDEYKFDIVYSVVWDHRELLYPRMARRGRILPALTGYVNDDDIESLEAFARSYQSRGIDIGYRAKFLPANFGSYGQIKGLIADQAEQAARSLGLRTDISTSPEKVFLGDDWLRFLGNCKYCIGSEGGSSLWDPEGSIMDAVRAYTAENPLADFAEIEAVCFPGLDRRYVFSAISPRLFEAAMVRCGQLLLEAPYLGVLKPWEHYVPLTAMYENPTEVTRYIKDAAEAQRIIARCYEALIEAPDYRYSRHAARVLEEAKRLVEERRITADSPARLKRLFESPRKHRMAAVRSRVAGLIPPKLKVLLRELRAVRAGSASFLRRSARLLRGK